MELNPSNYLSLEADKVYMSHHQYQNWMTCAAKEKARLDGKIPEQEDPLHFLVGNYIDQALLTPETFEAWKKEHNDDITKNKGKELKAPFVIADKMIARIRREPVAMKMLEGDSQYICTGLIAGVPWKIMVDKIKPKSEILVDLKTCRDVKERIWDSDIGMKVTFFEHYGYWLQLSSYREIIFQNFGKKFLPMILAVDKQDHPAVVALAFQDEYRMDQEVENIKANLPQIMRWKDGKEEPKRCGECDYCRDTAELKIVVAENQGMRKPAYMDW